MRNEANADRLVRGVGAVVALVVALVVGFPSVVAWVLLAVAVILGVTAAVGFCPLYRLFGINTCKLPAAKTDTRQRVGAGR
jgi:hypothetical protein